MLNNNNVRISIAPYGRNFRGASFDALLDGGELGWEKYKSFL